MSSTRYTSCDMFAYANDFSREFISYRIRAKASIYRNCIYAIISRLLCKHIAEFSVGRKIMKLPFPSYKTTFTCDLPMYEVNKKIQDCVARNQRELKIKKSEFAGGQSFVIETHTGSVSGGYNSLIKANLKSLTNKKTEISMLFEMKLSVKIMSVLLISLWLFIISTMVIISLKNNQPLSFDYFVMPVTLMVLLVFSNIIALKITSKSKLKIFLKEFGFNPKDKENSPKLEWVKIFNCKNKS